MDVLQTVKDRLKRKNLVLFAQDDIYFDRLRQQLNSASRKAIVLWALQLAEEGAGELSRIMPLDERPQTTVRLATLWAQGELKMPVAKRAILDCHSAAKETNNPEAIAYYHAVAQGCSCVHTPGHALGYPLYELTALVRRYGIDSCEKAICERVADYESKLAYWCEHAATYSGSWAPFLEE